jgi:hypothetical protein
MDTTLAFLLDKAEQITNQVKARGGRPTADERRQVEDYLARARQIKDTAELRDQIERMQAPYGVKTAGTGNASPFAAAILADLSKAVDAHTGRLDVKSAPHAEASAYTALTKSPTLPSPNVVAPTSPSITFSGRDLRFLWPNLDIRDATGFTAVSDYRQTARTVTGDVERSPVATTDKATLDLTLEHQVAPMRQFAVVVDGVANEMLENLDGLRTFLDNEGRYQVETALDGHVLAQIAAASPAAGNTGTGLVEQVRNGVTAMRAAGADPQLLVLNAGDAATLDLTEDGAGSWVFPLRDTGSSSPLWGLRVIERPGSEDPYLIDPRMLGSLYLGSMRFDLDPYTHFAKNLTNLRIEVNGLYFVRNVQGAYRIGTA